MSAVNESRRLEDLDSTHHMDAPRNPEFDRVTALAASVIDTPTCLISLVDDHRQFFASYFGLGPPWCDLRETPLSHSFCQHVVNTREILKIIDSRRDQRVEGNLAIDELNVIAYLGFPIISSRGEVLGSFCVIDTKVRDWTDDEIEKMRGFVGITSTLMSAVESSKKQRTALDLILHDLKSPLTGVQMTAALLSEHVDKIPEMMRPLVSRLEQAGKAAVDLVARAGAEDQAVLEEAFCELGGMIETGMNSVRDSARAKSIDLNYMPVDDLVSVKTESWVLERVLENLFSNAVKFTPEGGSVDIEVIRVDGRAGLEIHDGGPGFTVGDRVQLFERYAKLSAKPTAGEQSTGLGLSITKTLLDGHGGEIQLLESETGARFRVLFRERGKEDEDKVIDLGKP